VEERIVEFQVYPSGVSDTLPLNFNSLLGVWKCGQTLSFLFDILCENLVVFIACGFSLLFL